MTQFKIKKYDEFIIDGSLCIVEIEGELGESGDGKHRFSELNVGTLMKRDPHFLPYVTQANKRVWCELGDRVIFAYDKVQAYLVVEGRQQALIKVKDIVGKMT